MKEIIKEQLFNLIKAQPECPISCQVASFKNSIFVLPINGHFIVLIRTIFPHLESNFLQTFAQFSHEENALFTHNFHLPELKTFVFVMNLASVLTLMQSSGLFAPNDED